MNTKLQNCWIKSQQVNTMVPYGRGADDIARQIKGETGATLPLEQLTRDVQVMLDAWKNQTYRDAWRYMEACAESVTKPGYLVNPWGRMRRFSKTSDYEKLAAMEREAQNYPIQSTVADTCMIAMWLMRQYREQHGLHFRLINQIHDAIMLEVPEAEIEPTKIMYKETMGKIDIPIQGGTFLRLGVDIDTLTRWGEKKKD